MYFDISRNLAAAGTANPFIVSIPSMIYMVVADDLQCLKLIALMGGCNEKVWVSSQALAKKLDTSPQTASRRLISLENQQIITRAMRPDGQYIVITRQGEELLRREYADYRRIFEPKRGTFVLEGAVIDGLGEGRYYVSNPGYHDQFVEKLGFEPYPGTLNLRLTPATIPIRSKIDALDWIEVEGFVADNRTFGGARCLPCSVGGQPGAIVMPGRSHYPEDIIEIISPVELRRIQHLETGSIVVVEIAYD
jgi:riboflavin kinase